ncbi:MAG: hypothetical protein ACREAC_16735, partial [Blastocatellia bacterium]
MMRDRLLSEESDSLGLAFESHDDTLNYISELVESANDLLAINKLDLVERYKGGIIAINCEIDTDWNSSQYSLVLRAIPGRLKEHLNPSSCTACLGKSLTEYDGSQGAMFIETTQLVQSP